MFFVFIISIFGFFAGYHVYQSLESDETFSKITRQTLVFSGILVFFVFLFLIPKTYFTLLLGFAVPITITVLIDPLLLKWRVAKFRKNLRTHLTSILLRMKIGRSFRQALNEVIEQTQGTERLSLEKIQNFVIFFPQLEIKYSELSQMEPPLIREITSEFQKIDSEPHLSLRRLELLRQKLQMQDDFRHKTGQAMAQIRAQSILMSALYFAILIFVFYQFGWRKNWDLIALSLSLFSLGMLWIWNGGRRIRWTV